LLPWPVLEGIDQHEFPVRCDLGKELADLARRHGPVGPEADHHDRAELAFGLEVSDDSQAGAELLPTAASM
jgi:hypothetical protein